jgi:4-hydroxy-tetrahydrodipicolinate reductase
MDPGFRRDDERMSVGTPAGPAFALPDLHRLICDTGSVYRDRISSMSSKPPSDPIRLLVYGAGGRMGRAVLELAPRFPGLQIEAAVSRGHPTDASELPVFTAEQLAAVPAFDVAIDFSLHSGFDTILDECRRRRSALVSGTTGLSTAQRIAMEEASKDIPILWASNFSPGVAVLARLLERAAAMLPGWDCEILDVHHRHKRDAPSGTAVSLAEAVIRGRDDGSRWVVRLGDHAMRARDEVGIASIRGGEVVGEHTVSLFGPHERIEFKHRAEDRSVFAHGAMLAAQALAGRPPGLYGLADLLLSP